MKNQMKSTKENFMSEAIVEHVNITVRDPDATADMLCDLFGWHVRWRGDAKYQGTTLHVGGEKSYIAVYSSGGNEPTKFDRYKTPGAMNHIGVVVDDLNAVEAKVKAAGFTPHNHADYEPGRRFYFDDMNGIEIEVVSYS